jgi:hypothetical protein
MRRIVPLVCLLLATLAAGPGEAAGVAVPILDRGDGGGTSLVVINTARAVTAVHLSVHDAAGHLIEHAVAHEALAPGGRLTYPPPGSAWPPGAATVVVDSDRPVHSAAVLEAADGRVLEVFLPRAGQRVVTVPHAGVGRPAALTLTNVGRVPVRPEVEALDAHGRVIGRVGLGALDPMAQVTGSVDDWIGSDHGWDAALIDVTADQPITGVHLLGPRDGSADVAALSVDLPASRRLAVPVFEEAGGLALWTRVGLVNTHDRETTAVVEAFDAQGNSLGPVSVPPLPPRSVTSLATPNAGGMLAPGTARLQITAAAVLRGYAMIGTVQGGGITAVAASRTGAAFELIGSDDGTVLAASPLVGNHMESFVGAQPRGSWKTASPRLPVEMAGVEPRAAGCRPIAPGAEPSAGTIDAAGEVDCYGFSITGADAIRIRVVKIGAEHDPFDPAVEVRRSNGDLLCAATTADDSTCAVTGGGRHVLRIRIKDVLGTHAGGYRIHVQLLQNPVACTALDFGAPAVPGSIGVSAEVDCYTVTGAAGDRLMVRARRTSGALRPRLEIVRPDGTTLCAVIGTDLRCSTDATGRHTILVSDESSRVGDYGVHVQRLNDPVGCTTADLGGGLVPGTIGVPGQVGCVTFRAAAGDRVRVRAVATSGDLVSTMEVVQPDGLTATCAELDPPRPGEMTCAIAVAGWHTILVSDHAPRAPGGISGIRTGDYAVLARRLNSAARCATLTFGAAPTAHPLAQAGDMHCYTFTAAAGDRVRVRLVRTLGDLEPLGELVRPDGSTQCAPTTSDEFECVATAGNNTVLVRDAKPGDRVGRYRIAIQRLNDPVGCVPLDFGGPSTAGSIGAPAAVDCYTFTGAVNDAIHVHVIPTGGALAPYADAVTPRGVLCGQTPPGSGELGCKVRLDGVHAIFVRDGGEGTRTGDYAIYLQRLNDPVGCTPLRFGAPPRLGTLGAVAQVDCYTFASPEPVRWRLVRTDGDAEPVVLGLPLPGPREGRGWPLLLVADGTPGTRTGEYRISVQRLDNPGRCTALEYDGAPAAGTLTVGEMDCYTFMAAEGDVVRARVIRTSGAVELLSELLTPAGTSLCGPATPDGEFGCTVFASGRHTILVADASPGTRTGGYLVRVRRLNNTSACERLTVGAAPVTRTVAAGEVDCVTFAGRTGDTVRLRVIKTGGDLQPLAEVVTPDGTTVCSPTTADEITCDIVATATHTIRVRDAAPGTRTGEYRVTVQRLNDPVGCAAVSFGVTAMPGEVALSAEQDCFTVTASAGDRVHVRVTRTGGDVDPLTDVVSPDASVACFPTTADEFTCTLSTGGTHTVFVRDAGAGTRTGSYEVVIYRLNDPVGCGVLSFGVAPTGGAIATASQVNCFTVDAVAGDTIRLRMITTAGDLAPVAEILQPDGTVWCSADTLEESTCAVAVTGTHGIWIRDGAPGTRTGAYRVGVQRLNDPVGCTPLAFDAAPTGGTIDEAAETDCFTFIATAGDTVQVHVVKTDGDVDPATDLVRPGGVACSPFPTTLDDFACVTTSTGTHAIFVRDAGLGTRTGSYTIAIEH